MAYMDNAYRLVLGLLKSKMIPLAFIDALAGVHISQIETAIARQPDDKLSQEMRNKIFKEINKNYPDIC